MKFHVVLLLAVWSLAGFGCDREIATPTAAPTTVKQGSDVVVRVDGVPILREDVERLAKFIQLSYYNLSLEYASTVALGNSLLARAAALAHFADKVEPLKLQIEQIHEKIVAGEDFASLAESVSDFALTTDSPSAEMGVIGKLDYLIGEKLGDLKAGQTSSPILTKIGWCLVHLDENAQPVKHLKAALRFQSIVLAFDKVQPYLTAQQLLDEAAIEIVDPEFHKIVPEWAKYRPGARQAKPIDLPLSQGK